MLQYSFPYSTLINFIVFALLGLYALRYRKRPGGAYFVGMTLLLAFNAFAGIMELTSASFETKLFWRNLQQIPLLLSPIACLGLVLDLTGMKRTKRDTILKLITIPAVVYLILIFTDSYHHLMRVNVTLEPFGQTERIRVQSTSLSIFFLVTARIIGLLTLAVMLLHLRKVSRFYRNQHLLVMVALLFPYVFTLLSYISDVQISVSLSTIPMGILLFYALFQYKLLRVRPLAKEKVFEVIQDGILVVDPHGLIADVNPAGLRIWWELAEGELNRVHGEKLEESLSNYPELLSLYKLGEQAAIRLQIRQRHYSVSLLPIMEEGISAGTLLLFADITDRHHYESDLLKRATMDGLTQVYNRQHVMEMTEEALSDMEPETAALALMLLDIDYFKSINDTYGHHVGDQVLEQFALVLKREAQDKGLVGRMGGEEFAVVLPGYEPESAYPVAETIRKAVEGQAIRPEGLQEPIHITVSIGIAGTKRASSTFKELYQQADEALYEAKKQGRNRTIGKEGLDEARG
ncbi:histidine kinase N-terminal 7TM domain-containing diguanylate cyclase [Paenibacillus silviterrae]|uniref:histidine kinase N-terminal 7TM domain-containing diguanylate cyclase n=1 Tax=Paenibacillus silviterrae TaxID=3242194 RepID=UPI00254375B1|nr:diguanylate cyclase [Paenibacillus chinjuensis]